MLPELRQRYPIASLGLFGSWVRGEQRPDSDLDLLVVRAALAVGRFTARHHEALRGASWRTDNRRR